MSTGRIVVVGAAGQLGRALSAAFGDDAAVVPLTSADIDLTDDGSVAAALSDLGDGDVVLNAAAYTAVDDAETHRDAAFAVNADGPRRLAAATSSSGARLIHVSTDYVFTAQACTGRPFEPDDLVPSAVPATVYGASKLAGELAVRAEDSSAIVVRTAWVFTGGASSPDFVGTMRRLEEQREQISVVDDQRGSPTYAPDLAEGLVELTRRVQAGESSGATLHAVNAGEGTWFDVARAVFAGVGADPQRV
ncbi:MAG: dTDP-4-dehydrorhamnose reductase, partial [Gordonia sp. (in: high G+C Gram-positive bacteria)]